MSSILEILRVTAAIIGAMASIFTGFALYHRQRKERKRKDILIALIFKADKDEAKVYIEHLNLLIETCKKIVSKDAENIFKQRRALQEKEIKCYDQAMIEDIIEEDKKIYIQFVEDLHKCYAPYKATEINSVLPL